MPRMQFRIKSANIAEKKEYLTKKTVNLVTNEGIVYHGDIQSVSGTEVMLHDHRSHKHLFKIDQINEIVAEEFV